MDRESPHLTVFRLAWYSYLRTLGYFLATELLFLWLLAAAGRGPSGYNPLAGFVLGHWWLWLGLTLALGLAGRAGTRVGVDGRRIALMTWGVAWRSLALPEVDRARVLRAGNTVAILARKAAGGFRIWRQSGLAAVGALAGHVEKVLGDRVYQALAPPYEAKHGTVWSITGGSIRAEAARSTVAYAPDTLRGIKFLFIQGDDLPIRLYLFPADGGPTRAIGREVRFFPFLAADILRFAKANSVRTVCADLGQKRPRIFQGRAPDAPTRPRSPRAWEEEGRW